MAFVGGIGATSAGDRIVGTPSVDCIVGRTPSAFADNEARRYGYNIGVVVNHDLSATALDRLHGDRFLSYSHFLLNSYHYYSSDHLVIIASFVDDYCAFRILLICVCGCRDVVLICVCACDVFRHVFVAPFVDDEQPV